MKLWFVRERSARAEGADDHGNGGSSVTSRDPTTTIALAGRCYHHVRDLLLLLWMT